MYTSHFWEASYRVSLKLVMATYFNEFSKCREIRTHLKHIILSSIDNKSHYYNVTNSYLYIEVTLKLCIVFDVTLFVYHTSTTLKPILQL